MMTAFTPTLVLVIWIYILKLVDKDIPRTFPGQMAGWGKCVPLIYGKFESG